MQFGEYEITEARERTDWRRVTAWLASSYWTPGITEDRIRRGSENSALVVGAFKAGVQGGFLRVISDKTRFAYICDVWVDELHRGKGLARAMVKYCLQHPDYQTVKWLLATETAHGVYAKIGFEALSHPDRWMSRQPNIEEKR